MRKGTVQADGKRIQQLREWKGWNQATLAKEADLESPKTITHVETGKPVLVATLGSIAAALGVELQSLLPRPAPESTPPAGVRSGLLPGAPALLIGREDSL